jgi:hypothetical protein
MKPEDRKRLKQHIEMIVEHKMPAEETVISEGSEPSPSDVSMTQDVLMNIKTPSSTENTNPSILRKTDGLGNCILQETK